MGRINQMGRIRKELGCILPDPPILPITPVSRTIWSESGRNRLPMIGRIKTEIDKMGERVGEGN